MPEKETQKRNLIAFEPADDVLEELDAYLMAKGNAHGQKSHAMNRALKIALPIMRRQDREALDKLDKSRAKKAA